MPARSRQFIASMVLLALCGLTRTASAAEKYKIVNEGHGPAGRGAAEAGGQVHARKRQAADGFLGAASAAAAATRQYASSPQVRRPSRATLAREEPLPFSRKGCGPATIAPTRGDATNRREMDNEIDHDRNGPAARG